MLALRFVTSSELVESVAKAGFELKYGVDAENGVFWGTT